MKKILAMMVAVAMSAPALMAQEATAEKKPSFDIGVDVASSYIWRGQDIYGTGKATADGKKQSAFPVVPAIQPSLTYYAPVEGLSFNIWASYAASARSDAKGGARKLDEIDYTMAYEFENAAGAWSFALIYYAYPTGGSNYGELNFGYSLPLPLSPTIGVAAADNNGGSTTFLTFGVSHAIEAGAITVEPGLTFAYWAFPDSNKNMPYLELGIPVSFAATDSVSINFNYVGVLRIMTDTSLVNKKHSVTSGLTTTSEDTPAFISMVSLGASYSM